MDEDVLPSNSGPVSMTRAVREAMADPMVSRRLAAVEAVFERGRAGLDDVRERSTPSPNRGEIPHDDWMHAPRRWST